MQTLIKFFPLFLGIFAFFTAAIPAQTPAKSTVSLPVQTLVQIVRAEDELRFDKVLETLLSDKNNAIRERAALAAGRIGDEAAVPFLINLLENDTAREVRAMAAFALGEIESAKGADAVMRVLANGEIDGQLRARAVEAAGKIAAAISASDKAKAEQLGEAILDALEFEDARRSRPNTEAILFGLTAVLRARPPEGDFVAAKFVTYSDEQIRQNATNALARLRAKNANEAMKIILLNDDDAICRANAARVLGIAEDKTALDLLITAATEDDDQRVRVAAIRALVNLKDKKAVEPLLASAEKLFESYKKAQAKNANPAEKNEILEIITTLGRLLTDSNDEEAVKLLKKFREADKFSSPETEIAFARIAPKLFLQAYDFDVKAASWRRLATFAQGLGELATSQDKTVKDEAAKKVIEYYRDVETRAVPFGNSGKEKSMPDVLRALAAFKIDDLAGVLRKKSAADDVQIRATAAELLRELPASKENFEALKKAFDDSFLRDKDSNDAMLAILDALFKVNQKDSLPIISLALDSDDYLVRKKAFELLRKDNSDYSKTMIDRALSQNKNRVLPPINPRNGTKQGVLLNKTADYLRAVSRKNNTVKAVLTTEKGTFTIDLMPEHAPLTVDNFIKLARTNYFNGIAFHRIVPNFVVQDGDPRGDGNGGPGYSIRCEINMLKYERGVVGMALSGKDTGGSQWFVTHSPQPHLDGGYTVFGKMNETAMKVVDSLARGDKILQVKIVETLPPKTQRTQIKKK